MIFDWVLVAFRSVCAGYLNVFVKVLVCFCVSWSAFDWVVAWSLLEFWWVFGMVLVGVWVGFGVFLVW